MDINIEGHKRKSDDLDLWVVNSIDLLRDFVFLGHNEDITLSISNYFRFQFERLCCIPEFHFVTISLYIIYLKTIMQRLIYQFMHRIFIIKDY